SPSMHELNFEFTALSFTLPENVEFQYRLKGLDDNWSDYTTTRNVSYTRLPHGDYSFEVRACNIAGTWDPDPVALRFEVLPFYWQTWWFRLTVLAVFTAAVVSVVRYVSFQRLHHRLQLLEQQAAVQKERARIAKDIHDDLGADLTQIAFLGELAQQDRSEPEKVAERIGTISSTARQAVKSLDEIVWAVNPRNDTLPHLIDYAGQFAVDYLRPTGIRCRLDFPEQIPARELSTNLRHNLFLTIKEALHNIVKHAGATEIWLRVDLRDETLEMIIEDNGRGFTQAPDNALADGLRNMRQRLAEIGGECRVESQPDSGTRVILRLPWQKD
ncbi:MAG TPA: triple tyrosine motif-containing protein, partial [Pseudomonadales bacterium]|nr:triple tyrosine motif-containing protein [Pseudomonadales bacterium]